MSFLNKEKVFTILREYHQNAFPDVLSTKEMAKLRIEFETLEDQVINMIINVVARKALFADSTAELLAFQKKVQIKPSGDRKEDADRNLFTTKIAQLFEILSMAKEATFTLKPVKAKVPKAA